MAVFCTGIRIRTRRRRSVLVFIVSLGRWLEMGGLHKVQFLREVVQLALL